MPSDNRRIMLTVVPDAFAAAGLDPETAGARDVGHVLKRWGESLREGAASVAAKFGRAEWCCLADAAGGLLWEESPAPAVALKACVEDANALEGLGAKWFGDEGADAAVAALGAKLDALTIPEGEAVAAALRWVRERADVDLGEDRWWHPAFRAARDAGRS